MCLGSCIRSRLHFEILQRIPVRRRHRCPSSYYSSNGYYQSGAERTTEKYDDTKALSTDVAQLCPDIPVWVEYSWSKWNRIRLSGIYRHSISYRDLLNDRLRGASGWGVMLSGNVQPAKPVILYYQIAYGEGHRGLSAGYSWKTSLAGYRATANPAVLNLLQC